MRVGETTISRLADGTAVRQTIAAPKRMQTALLSQDRGSACRQDYLGMLTVEHACSG